MAEIRNISSAVNIIPEKKFLVRTVEDQEEEVQYGEDEEESIVPFVKITKHLDENTLPATFDDVIMSMFDRLSSFEQLLLKCASVLGNQFFREDLIVVMNGPSEILFAAAIKRLFQLHVLGCASANEDSSVSTRIRNSSSLQDAKRRAEEIYCLCSVAKDIDMHNMPSYAFCKNISFKFRIFCSTIYATIPINQKITFHTRALQSIKTRSKKCDSCKKNEEFVEMIVQEEKERHEKKKSRHDSQAGLNIPSSLKSSNVYLSKSFVTPSEDVLVKRTAFALPDQKEEDKLKDMSHLERNLGVILSEALKKLFREKDKTKVKRLYWVENPHVMKCTCFKELSQAYEELVHHAHMAELVVFELKYLITYAVHSIKYGKYDKALRLLLDAEQAYEQCMFILKQEIVTVQDKATIEKKKKMIPLEYMKFSKKQIHTYSALAYLYLGQLHQAAVILNFVTRRFFFRSVFWFQVLLMNWPEISLAYREHLTRKMILKTEIYNSLSKLLLLKNELGSSISAGRRSYMYASSTKMLQQKTTSLANYVDLCLLKGKFKAAESKIKSGLKSCLALYTASNLSELIYMGHLYTCIFKTRFFKGDLMKAIAPGLAALNISQQVGAFDAELYILPKLTKCLMMTRNFRKLATVLVPHIFLDEDSKTYQYFTKKKMYYKLILDVFLETGVALGPPFEAFLSVKKTISRRQMTIEHEINRVYALGVWLWYLRRREFEYATAWIIEEYDVGITHDNCYNTLRMIQCQLLWLVYKLDNTSVLSHRLLSNISRLKKEFKSNFKSCQTRAPFLLPRHYHLKAYYVMITRTVKQGKYLAQKFLDLGLSYAEKHNNYLEQEWIKHSKLLWWRPEVLENPEYWIINCETAEINPDNIDDIDWYEVMFSLRLPRAIVEEIRKSSRGIRSFGMESPKRSKTRSITTPSRHVSRSYANAGENVGRSIPEPDRRSKSEIRDSEKFPFLKKKGSINDISRKKSADHDPSLSHPQKQQQQPKSAMSNLKKTRRQSH